MKLTDKQIYDGIKAYLENGKILAIKNLRLETKAGLKDAKDILEESVEIYLNREEGYPWNWTLNFWGKGFIRNFENKTPKNPWGISPYFAVVDAKDMYHYGEVCIDNDIEVIIEHYSYWDNCKVFIIDSGIWWDLNVKNKEDLEEKLKEFKGE